MTRPAIIGMWVHKNCIHFLTLMDHNFVFHDSVAMKFSALIKHLDGYTMQVTE